MPESSKKYKNIVDMLDRYAQSTRDWQIARRQHIARGGNKFDFNLQYRYPYDDDIERDVINHIDEYLLELEPAERQQVNGQLLHEYKKYLSQPFAKHAIVLATRAITDHPLSDEDKIKFLEDLFKYRKETNATIFEKFDNRTLYKLANYNPNGNLEITNRLYNKAVDYLSGAKRKNDQEMALLYGMFKVFTQRVEILTPEAVANYAGVYFRIADRMSKVPEASFLASLAAKTPNSLETARLCGDRFVLDKDAMKLIFGAYANHVLQSKDFNAGLAEQMDKLASDVLGICDYSMKEAEELAAVLTPNRGRAGKKATQLAEMADRILFKERSLLAKQPGWLRQIKLNRNLPSDSQVVDYAAYLFDLAARYPNADIGLVGLFQMMTPNGQINKKLVLDVVDAYGESLTYRQMEDGRYNEHLHYKMTKMLQNSVIEYDYTSNDVDEVRRHVAAGAGRHDDFVEMGRVIETGFYQTGDWRYSASKAPQVRPITHQSRRD